VILADTSAWAEYDRATGSAVDLRLTELISADGPVAVTEPVIMKSWQGCVAMRGQQTFAGFCCASTCTTSTRSPTSTAPPRIYRRCRQACVTPRGLTGCMIAAVAHRHQATLLACDADLDRVARVIGIGLDQPARP
jgi:hypothetical protein